MGPLVGAYLAGYGLQYIFLIKALGIEPRVELRRHDLMKPLDSDGAYDMAISNLVFHNLGKKRYLAVYYSMRSRMGAISSLVTCFLPKVVENKVRDCHVVCAIRI